MVREGHNLLPAEIWRRTSSYLSLSSQAALAVTCRRLYDDCVMRNLKQDVSELKKFKTVTKFGRLLFLAPCGKSLLDICHYPTKLLW